MAIQLQKGQKFYVTKLFHKEKSTDAYASTSRGKKDNRTYSNWTIRFVGGAHKKALELLRENSLISVESGIMTCEKYVKDGQTVYPKMAQTIIFDFSVSPINGNAASQEQQQQEPEVSAPASTDEDDIPF